MSEKHWWYDVMECASSPDDKCSWFYTHCQDEDKPCYSLNKQCANDNTSFFNLASECDNQHRICYNKWLTIHLGALIPASM